MQIRIQNFLRIIRGSIFVVLERSKMNMNPILNLNKQVQMVIKYNKPLVYVDFFSFYNFVLDGTS